MKSIYLVTNDTKVILYDRDFATEALTTLHGLCYRLLRDEMELNELLRQQGMFYFSNLATAQRWHKYETNIDTELDSNYSLWSLKVESEVGYATWMYNMDGACYIEFTETLCYTSCK